LSKVPESYHSMTSALMATTDLDKLTIDIIQSKVLAEESMRRNGQASAARISKTKPKLSGPCSFCGSETHHESTCWKKHPDLRPKSKGGKGKGKGKDKDKGKGKDNLNCHAHAIAPSVNV
ncbi:hypothetical protein BV20DRAFT_905884, partial [Pilatotrama ljubarskyi]